MHASGETRANTQPRMLLSEVLRAGGVVQPLQTAVGKHDQGALGEQRARQLRHLPWPGTPR